MKRSLGRMRHRLTIMTITRVDDSGGGFARADVVQGTIPARISTASKNEQAIYSQRQQRITHEALCRFNSNVVQGATVYWLDRGATAPTNGTTTIPTGTALYIEAVEDADPDKRPGEFMKLLLREGGAL